MDILNTQDIRGEKARDMATKLCGGVHFVFLLYKNVYSFSLNRNKTLLLKAMKLIKEQIVDRMNICTKSVQHDCRIVSFCIVDIPRIVLTCIYIIAA